MKVVHLNTSVNESSAPYKLHEALCKMGIESKLLVLSGGEELQGVKKATRSFFYRVKRKFVAMSRMQISKKYMLQEYMPFTIQPFGIDVCKMAEIKEADLIWLHWICADYMSLDSIKKLLELGKPVFWTCHDNYPFTGGCHVRLGCNRYEMNCGKCPQLQSKEERDISRILLEEKMRKLQYDNLYIVSPSRWMDDNVGRSAVFRKHKHFVLPNAIDTELFSPKDWKDARKQLSIEQDHYVILVGLKANEKIPYNGTDYLWKILEGLYERCPNGKLNQKMIQIVTFGTDSIEPKCKLPFINKGYIRDKASLASLYSAADLYLVTSLEDSFNQTVAECMACGTPVVAFNNGGIADIIDHRVNGYLAEYKSVEDAIEGILEISKKTIDYVTSTREKIISRFSYKVVSKEFIKYVQQL